MEIKKGHAVGEKPPLVGMLRALEQEVKLELIVWTLLIGFIFIGIFSSSEKVSWNTLSASWIKSVSLE